MKAHMSWYAAAGFGIFLAAFLLLAAILQGVAIKNERRPVRAGTVEVPQSSVESLSELGIRGHSNVELFVPYGSTPPQPPPREFYEKERPAVPFQGVKPPGGAKQPPPQ